jgi:hypothetical protein
MHNRLLKVDLMIGSVWHIQQGSDLKQPLLGHLGPALSVVIEQIYFRTFWVENFSTCVFYLQYQAEL